MLIGVCGKAGAGKDTIGDYLVKKYDFIKIAVADPLKRLVKDVFVLDDNIVYDRVAREQELKNWPKWSVRKLLQYIGTELFRSNVDEDIWIKSLWYRLQKHPCNNYVITDLRFPNEINFLKDNIKNNEFVCLKVIRDGCDGSVGLAGHASESYDLKADHEIINDSSIWDLYNKVDVILKNVL